LAAQPWPATVTVGGYAPSSEQDAPADWGDAVLEMISAGIQKNFPGIRGFSISNLKNMRQFYKAYAQGVFSQLVTGQFEIAAKSQSATGQIARAAFLQSSTAKNDNDHIEVFLHIGFTHHILLLQKCPDLKERFFYMQQKYLPTSAQLKKAAQKGTRS